MKRSKQLKHLILSMMALFVFVLGVSSLKTDVYAAAKPKLSATSATLADGATKKLTVKNAKGKKVSWSSTNSSVASVSSAGKVTAKKGGSATIKAKVAGKTLKCKIKVVGLNIKSATCTVGQIFGLSVKNGKKTKWSSSNANVASVTKTGKVTVKQNGKATITCKSNGKTLTCKVYVPSISATSLMLTPYNTGKGLSLSNYTGSVSWSSSNSSVASVNSSGTVLANKAGVTTITAKNNGKSFKCTVSVVNLNHTTLNFTKPGETAKLVCENFAGAKTWSSSNGNVVAVSGDGDIQARGNGSAVISCNIGAYSLKCYVFVGESYFKNYNDITRPNAVSRLKVGVDYAYDLKDTLVPPAPPVTPVDPTEDEEETGENTGEGTEEPDPPTPPVNPYVDKGYRTYTVYGQSYSKNKDGLSVNYGGVKISSSYMPNHGCAACSLTTVLSGFAYEVENKLQCTKLPLLSSSTAIGPQATVKEFGVEFTVFHDIKQASSSTDSWTYNYSKSLSSQMPVSLQGISKILTWYEIPNKYCQKAGGVLGSFNDEAAIMDIYKHLLTGNPVVIEVCDKKRNLLSTKNYSSNKWSNSSHTMVLLAMTKINGVEYAVVADPADRSASDHGEGNKRIKYAKLDEIVAYMFSNTSNPGTSHYYGGKDKSGGYILVNP